MELKLDPPLNLFPTLDLTFQQSVVSNMKIYKSLKHPGNDKHIVRFRLS